MTSVCPEEAEMSIICTCAMTRGDLCQRRPLCSAHPKEGVTSRHPASVGGGAGMGSWPASSREDPAAVPSSFRREMRQELSMQGEFVEPVPTVQCLAVVDVNGSTCLSKHRLLVCI